MTDPGPAKPSPAELLLAWNDLRHLPTDAQFSKLATRFPGITVGDLLDAKALSKEQMKAAQEALDTADRAVAAALRFARPEGTA
jgi:hypothetical protein